MRHEGIMFHSNSDKQVILSFREAISARTVSEKQDRDKHRPSLIDCYTRCIAGLFVFLRKKNKKKSQFVKLM